MKSQLYRVKQMAAQKVGMAEKTDLLTEDLLQVEKTVEKVKIACTNFNKKLNACMLSSGLDVERRKKKLNQLHLGQIMVENTTVLGDKSLLGGIMLKAGEAQCAIAGELATYETELDGQLLAPLQNLTEVEIPNINIIKKKLSHARLDMDTCKTRWQNAVKVSQGSSGNRIENLAKADLLKSEYEDQSALFQQLQDQLATEMLTFVAGERKYAQWAVKMLEAQKRYHEASLKILNACLPNVEQQMSDDIFHPTFGCPLDVHLRVKDRKIALVIEECILFLLDNAMDVQGLFRLAGGSTKVRKLKASLNFGYVDMEEYICDVHAVTGVLKLYLRELPEPLLTFKLYEEWINASKIKSIDDQLKQIKELVDILPNENRCNLRYLVCFLSKLAENSEENKMSSSNIAIVIGPNLLWNPDDGGVSVATTGNVSIILELLIENCQYVFPEGCEFTRRQIEEERSDLINSRFDTKDLESTSPEHSSHTSGSNIFSDMSKKFQRTDKKAPVQGYCNPVASSVDMADYSTNEESPSNDVSSIHSTHKRNPSDVASTHGTHKRNPSDEVSTHGIHKRNPSDGVLLPPSTNTENELYGHKQSTSSVNGVQEKPPVREGPRRPAPPIPKYPPIGPPKSKPPAPPTSVKPTSPDGSTKTTPDFSTKPTSDGSTSEKM